MIIASRVSISMFIVFFYFIGTVSAQTDENNSINGHNLSNQSYDVRVALDHIFISKKNNSLEISEIVVFRNEGEEIYYSKDNHTFFAISTPLDAKNLKTQVMECCLVQEEGMVYMDPMQPIAQGSNFEMQISYTLIPEGPEYVFNKSAVYNTTSVLMFIDEKSGMSIDGSNETITLGGNEYKVISFNDLKARETISIPVKMTKEPDYLYAGLGVFSLFSIALIYRFGGKIFRKNKKEYTLEELESEKRKIFKTIYGFEKHAGSERSEELRKIIEEYRQKATQIFIKIDNLNNKGQSEPLEKGMKQT
ncbi:MAG: hypothetical protein Q7J35_12315 [Candidatus Methanoperedens sp.]|nr:hypothetical protein [Candidatus Methanoperedens sp.]